MSRYEALEDAYERRLEEIERLEVKLTEAVDESKALRTAIGRHRESTHLATEDADYLAIDRQLWTLLDSWEAPGE